MTRLRAGRSRVRSPCSGRAVCGSLVGIAGSNPIAVAERSKARVRVRSLAGVAGSILAGARMFVLNVVSKDKNAKCRTVKTKKQVWMKYTQSTREYKKIPAGTIVFFLQDVPIGSGAHPASCLIGSGSSFSACKATRVRG